MQKKKIEGCGLQNEADCRARFTEMKGHKNKKAATLVCVAAISRI